MQFQSFHQAPPQDKWNQFYQCVLPKYLMRNTSSLKNHKTKFWQQYTEHWIAFTYTHIIQKP